VKHILNRLVEMKADIWNESDVNRIRLPLDNSRIHNSKVTYGFKRAPYPDYSPNIAPSDFFLFGYMKEKLKGCSFKSLDDLE